MIGLKKHNIPLAILRFRDLFGMVSENVTQTQWWVHVTSND